VVRKLCGCYRAARDLCKCYRAVRNLFGCYQRGVEGVVCPALAARGVEDEHPHPD